MSEEELVEAAWTDDLCIGNALMDKDHRRMVELVNQLLGVMKAGLGREFVEDGIAQIVSHAVFHFGREERLMRQIDYVDYERHKAEHDALLCEVSEFESHLGLGAETLNPARWLFLRNWVFNHIRTNDKLFGCVVGSIVLSSEAP